MTNYNKKPKYIKSPYWVKTKNSKCQTTIKSPNTEKAQFEYRVKSPTSKAQFKSPNSKCQTTIKSSHTEKAQIEFYRKPIWGKRPTSKAQFKKPNSKCQTTIKSTN
jgi:hypothetical protein